MNRSQTAPKRCLRQMGKGIREHGEGSHADNVVIVTKCGQRIVVCCDVTPIATFGSRQKLAAHFRGTMAKPGQDTVQAVLNVFRKDDGNQHLLTADTLQTAALSLSAFYKASTHPYVIDKTKKCDCYARLYVASAYRNDLMVLQMCKANPDTCGSYLLHEHLADNSNSHNCACGEIAFPLSVISHVWSRNATG